MSKRTRRVGELLREVIAEILRKNVSDPRIGMVSILRVEVTSDLKNAIVYVSLFTDDSEKEKETLEGLESATRYIQKKAGKEVNLRIMPHIEWRISRGVSYSVHIQKVLDSVQKPEKEEDTQ